MRKFRYQMRMSILLPFCALTVLVSQAQMFTSFPHHAESEHGSWMNTLRMSKLAFAPAVDYYSGGYFAYSVAVADLNGDGKPDLAVTNACAGVPNCHGTVGVLLGNGDGTFQPALNYSSGGYYTYSIAVGDVNGDGKPDLLVASACGYSGGQGCVIPENAVGVLLGNGDGTFQSAVSYDAGGYVPGCCGSYSLAVADINGDGNLDLLVANPCEGSNCSDGENGTVGVLLGNGDGTFRPVMTYGSGGFFADSVAVADVNGDGKPDAIVANVCTDIDCISNDGVVGVLLGNGDGTFRPAVAYGTGGIQANAVAVGDVNADGRPDLVVANASACSDYSCNGTIGVLIGNGDGTFQPALTYSSGALDAISIVLADVNGDGKPDILVADNSATESNYEGRLGVLLGNLDGTFQTVLTYSSGGYGATWLAEADVNGDDKSDILVANDSASGGGDSEGSVGVLLNISSPPTFRTLMGFSGPDGGFPLGSLIQGSNDHLYGTTSSGGSQGGGTVFEINTKGAMTVLYNFCAQSNCVDGKTARAGLALASNGNLYGTTSSGGAHNNGTVFQITPKGALTTLYSFCSESNCTDGASPDGGVVQGTDGNLYGTTLEGGINNSGTIFKISTRGAMTTLYSFCSQPNCTDGGGPEGALVQATDENLYGTTSEGGVSNFGTVFEISMAGKLTSLHSFSGSDGYQPVAGLLQAADGNFYGTTDSGGARNSNCPVGCGTVFRITQDGTLTTLYSFCAQSGCADGLSPQAGLIQATDGNLYGTTASGGRVGIYCPYGCGTIFTITYLGTLTTLDRFCTKANCIDGYHPLSSLLQATNGDFYGTTSDSDAAGTIFGFDIGLPSFITFVSAAGKVGQTGGILGQGFTGTTSVALNGTPASFTVVSDTFIRATVPPGATTGYVTVTTPTGTLTSNVPFRVIE